MPFSFASQQENNREDIDINNCFNLSRTQRLYGFAGCFILGFVISILGSISLFLNNTLGFGILYSLGNIISISSTMFLVGPKTHFKRMFDKTRIWATCIFLGLMVTTLVIAFTIKSGILVLILCFFQFLAGIWYSLSYIPFARQAVTNCFKGLF